MPKIIDVLHSERHKKVKSGVKITKNISDTEKILHGDMYVGALADTAFKSQLISYLCHYFLEKGKNVLKPGQSLIIDSDAMGNSPKCSEFGSVITLHSRTNNKGEADCGVWFHAKVSQCDNILVLAGDTDIYMYGLVLFELGLLTNTSTGKKIAVERQYNKEYVSMNSGFTHIHHFENLQHLVAIKAVWPSLLCIYLLSGSDYISVFFRLPVKKIIKTFI